MGRLRDNAPVGNTCPIIDAVITDMENAKNELEYIRKNTNKHKDEIYIALSELNSGISEIEQVREANEQLRAWGNEYYTKSEKLEEEVSELKSEIFHLKIELKKYEHIK